MAEAKTLVAGDAEIPAETTQAAKKKDIILRMIRNLIGRAVASSNPAKEAPPYFNLLLALDPSAFRERLTRARMREISGDPDGAAEDIEWLVAHPPKEFDETQHNALGDWLARLRRR